ncbi:MAG: hypothetical protein ISN28_06955 [Ectothiorhodospiraceae bacterium AqS1]|nr:hypothetical protein [Ectothiorhodospiraceae bacterium AqS1]
MSHRIEFEDIVSIDSQEPDAARGSALNAVREDPTLLDWFGTEDALTELDVTEEDYDGTDETLAAMLLSQRLIESDLVDYTDELEDPDGEENARFEVIGARIEKIQSL